MSPAATIAPAQTTPNSTGGAQAPPTPLVPFTRASMHKTEDGNLDFSYTPDSAVKNVQVDVPASGFLRSILLIVEASGGSGTAAVWAADAPWSIIDQVTLHDLNGTPICGPITGYELYLINLLSGGRPVADPTKISSLYTAPATNGNVRFALRVPVQIRDRDALGSLPNMNASANYQLAVQLAPKSRVWTTDPSTIPTVRVTAVLETWANPTTHSAAGTPQATQPPALGTVQYHSVNRYPVVAGAQTNTLKRVGNLIRYLIVVGRNSSGARNADVLPSNTSLRWDTRSLLEEPIAVTHARIEEASGITVPTGVMCLPYHLDFDGSPGEELGDRWLQTVQSARIELGGVVSTAGSWSVITCDVVPQGTIWGV